MEEAGWCPRIKRNQGPVGGSEAPDSEDRGDEDLSLQELSIREAEQTIQPGPSNQGRNSS